MAKYERLSALDRTFLDLEYPETHMHVASVMTFDAALAVVAGGQSKRAGNADITEGRP